MKNFIKCIVVLMVGLFIQISGHAGESNPSRFVIGFTPGGNPAALKTQAVELAEELQKRFKIPVEIYISSDYENLINAMKEKKVDYAFFSSLSFVTAEEVASAKVLLKKVWSTEPFYFSALIVKKASKINKVSDLVSKRVAYVDKKSASGYLYPRVMLLKNKIQDKNFKEIVFSGNHAQSVKLLDEGRVDAIAVFSDDALGKNGAWHKFGMKKSSQYKVLWVSEPIPSDPFTVRKDFYEKYPKLTHTLMFALIDLFDQAKASQRFSEVLGNQDLVLATTRQYDPVREMVKTLNSELK